MQLISKNEALNIIETTLMSQEQIHRAVKSLLDIIQTRMLWEKEYYAVGHHTELNPA